MKNLRRTKNAQIGVALPVPDGRGAGQFAKFGTAGLRGILITDRATAETVANGKSAPGLKDGQATVELIGVHTTVTIIVAVAIAQFAPVYFDENGDITTVETDTQVGCTLAATTGPGAVEVALY